MRFGFGAFRVCDGVAEAHIADAESWCGTGFYRAKTLFNPLTHGAKPFVGDVPVTYLVIPDGMTEVGEYAFVGCLSTESVLMPRCVEKVGRGVFENCSALGCIFCFGEGGEPGLAYADEGWSAPCPFVYCGERLGLTFLS